MGQSKLKPEDKARWVAALRSGDYQQARKKLRSDAGYCCLGVFCDIFGDGAWVRSSNGAWFYAMGPDKLRVGGVPPLALCRSVGLSERDMYSLVELNDDEEKGFAEIADYIEAGIGV